MPQIGYHMNKSITFLINNHYDFYITNMWKSDQLLFDLHKEIDKYYNTNTEKGDFTGLNIMKHWKVFHHIQGVHKLKNHFVEKYGEKYEKIIFEELLRHIKDDIGFVPEESFYTARNMKKLRGF